MARFTTLTLLFVFIFIQISSIECKNSPKKKNKGCTFNGKTVKVGKDIGDILEPEDKKVYHGLCVELVCKKNKRKPKGRKNGSKGGGKGKKPPKFAFQAKEIKGCSATQCKDDEKVNWCGGHWRYPDTCKPGTKECEYYARWEFLKATDEIKFRVQTTNTDKWSGIGFSSTRGMPSTDVVLGWVEPSGGSFIFDGWIRGYSPPIVEDSQGITNSSARTEDGITTLEFVRKRISNDTDYDLSFTDDDCLYLVFPIKGGNVDYVSKKIKRHALTPRIPPERVCIRDCLKFDDNTRYVERSKRENIGNVKKLQLSAKYKNKEKKGKCKYNGKKVKMNKTVDLDVKCTQLLCTKDDDGEMKLEMQSKPNCECSNV